MDWLISAGFYFKPRYSISASCCCCDSSHLISYRVGSTFMTLTLTIERFMAVSKPLGDRARMTRILIWSTAVGSFFYNIPRFFEYYTDTKTAQYQSKSMIIYT